MKWNTGMSRRTGAGKCARARTHLLVLPPPAGSKGVLGPLLIVTCSGAETGRGWRRREGGAKSLTHKTLNHDSGRGEVHHENSRICSLRWREPTLILVAAFWVGESV
jgi:hypothetical protein